MLGTDGPFGRKDFSKDAAAVAGFAADYARRVDPGRSPDEGMGWILALGTDRFALMSRNDTTSWTGRPKEVLCSARYADVISAETDSGHWTVVSVHSYVGDFLTFNTRDDDAVRALQTRIARAAVRPTGQKRWDLAVADPECRWVRKSGNYRRVADLFDEYEDTRPTRNTYRARVLVLVAQIAALGLAPHPSGCAGTARELMSSRDMRFLPRDWEGTIG